VAVLTALELPLFQYLKLKEVSHWLHLLMKYADYKNILFTRPIKNCVSLVVMTANPSCDFRTLMSHFRRVAQETKGGFQLIGVSIGLMGAKFEQGILVDGCEILCR